MKYTAISDVSRLLLELLRRELTPGIIPKADSIGLCSPDNRGDFLVGVFLYNIEESESVRVSGRINEGLTTKRYPPIVLDLYYMITPYFKGDVKFLAEEEQVLLGRVIQIINDNSTLMSGGDEIVLELCNPTLEEKERIWSGYSPYKTSIFLSTRAVIVESTKTSEVSRVKEIRFETETK